MKREELIKALLEEYDVDEDRASAAVDSFVNKIKELDFLE